MGVIMGWWGWRAHEVAGGGWLLETGWPAVAFLWVAAAVFLIAWVGRARRWGWGDDGRGLGFLRGVAVGVMVGDWLGRWQSGGGGGWSSLWVAVAAASGGVVGCRLQGRDAGQAARDAGYVADVCAPAALVGLAFARLGCLWRGCDFGEPTGAGWGVRYPWGTAALRWLYEAGDVGALSRVGVPMHPFPLYEAAPTLLMGLWAMSARPSDGRLALGCAWGYASARCVAELYRGDAPWVALPWGGQARALALVCGVLSVSAAWLLSLLMSHPALTGSDEARRLSGAQM